ncbi:MAG: valine--tRNA ligase [Candidatus Staskawiczbacteria bacterium]|nr:valine--tRNA ligase [Candidatus Staskawiczbacteria bacterium]
MIELLNKNMTELSPQYNAKEVEDKIYKLWEESGFFNPDNLPKRHKKPFTIIMPPTNANGNLHAGHALVMTIEDIMTRYKRMRGFKALWLPGLDHAGFETQVVYEKKLEKEGRSRFKMTGEELYKEIWDFTQNSKTNIENQVRKMGASCDWSREKFTLDPDVVSEVQQTFKKMHDGGLVYRGKRIINWCVKHQTSLSDLETESTERIDKFYYLKYGPFTIATARPETKFGDKYVVMHPKDSRYKQYTEGQKINLEWINGPITATIIKDEAIDMEFGTGVMTITPWHDPIDFEIAERHQLDKEQIIDLFGKLLPIAGEFAGLKILEARPKIIEKLQSKGLVEKVEDNYKHIVKTCYKCNSLIEPQVQSQWFVKMAPLAKKAGDAVRAKKIQFIPDNYRKIFLYWMDNTIDWNISRQIVWGIPIPAKICEQCGHGMVDLENKLSSCENCAGSLRKDTDTFDTWFSSGQWPLLTLGFPKGKDFKTFYPTDIMESGSDLIFKWIPRMVIFGLYLAKKIPFDTVYLHGMINDAKGQKMSKSKGNVINPLDLIEKFGTDALRIGLVVGNTAGTSLALDENKIKGYRNFATKIWNASRYVLMNLGDYKDGQKVTLSTNDKKLLKDFQKLAKEVTKDMDNYKFYVASEKIYHYFWHVFCDKIIEDSKKDMSPATKYVLLKLLSDSLKLLHPFMPFITEEIYQQLPIQNKQKSLMVEVWPEG